MSRSQTKQKKSRAGRNVAVFFIVFIILEGLLMYGASKLFSSEDSVVKLAGYSFYLMDTNNMTNDMNESIPKNSLVIVSNITPARDKVGSAVLCKNVGDEGTTVAWLYSIEGADSGSDIIYTVYQEKYPDKMYELTSGDIIGIASSYYMTAGTILSFVTTTFGMIICIAAPLFLLIIIEIIILIARHSGRDDDDYDDDDETDGTDDMTLDDFLYGGENDEVYTASKPKDTYEEEFEDKYASMMNRSASSQIPSMENIEEYGLEPPLDLGAIEPELIMDDEQPSAPEISADSVQTNPSSAESDEKAEPEVDRQYYEKASKMIDDAVAARNDTPDASAAAEEPVSGTGGQSAKKASVSRQKSRPAAKSRPRPNVKFEPGNANAALEQLMKMMEEEQNKLKQSAGAESGKDADEG